MKTKFSGILTLLLAFVVQISFAQGKTVSGTVFVLRQASTAENTYSVCTNNNTFPFYRFPQAFRTFPQIRSSTARRCLLGMTSLNISTTDARFLTFAVVFADTTDLWRLASSFPNLDWDCLARNWISISYSDECRCISSSSKLTCAVFWFRRDTNVSL